MGRYLILSRFSPEAFRSPQELPKLADSVSRRIRESCPKLKWVDSYAAFGRFDVVDLVDSEDPTEVQRAAMIIRGLGHCTTETLMVSEWKKFLSEMGK